MLRNFESEPIPTLFAKNGGTWDMDVDAKGNLKGVGHLGDVEVHDLMERRGLLRILPRNDTVKRERDFAVYLYDQFRNTQPLDISAEKHLGSWCPDFGRYVTGPFYPFFSGDSSHFTHPLIAATTVNLIERRVENPQWVVLGAQGTDTADVAFLTLDDVISFDTLLPPDHFAGANRSIHEPNPDAPANFLRLAKIAPLDPVLYLPDPQYPSGTFWSFHNQLYSAADIAKFDPKEERIFEGQDTFYSPNSYARFEDGSLTIFRAGQEGDIPLRIKTTHPYSSLTSTEWLLSREAPPSNHISRHLTTEGLYDALMSVHTVNLGSQNPLADEIEKILDPSFRAIVVAAHGLGNGPEQLRAALIEAAKQEKIVIITSRAFIPFVNQRYEASLLSANENPMELGGLRYLMISGQHLTMTAARAIAVRALVEGLNQVQAKKLLEDYCKARPPHEGKEVVVEPVLVAHTGSLSRIAVDIPSSETRIENPESRNQLAQEFLNIWSTYPTTTGVEERFSQHVASGRIPDEFSWPQAEQEIAEEKQRLVQEQIRHLNSILDFAHISRYARMFVTELCRRSLNEGKTPESILPAIRFLGDHHENTAAIFSPYADLSLPNEHLVRREKSITGTLFETIMISEIALFQAYSRVRLYVVGLDEIHEGFDDDWKQHIENQAAEFALLIKEKDKGQS